MREYALPLAKDALADAVGAYEFTPNGPILIEMFPKHDDFAVRTLGLPGMIGALGACFGRVVTLDSPQARPPGTFSTGATLWHELAHVITLQMSKQRVPRWLTEGISVCEEGAARPEWGREMEVTFARALDQDKVLKLTISTPASPSPRRSRSRTTRRRWSSSTSSTTYGEPKLQRVGASPTREGIDTGRGDRRRRSASSIDELQTLRRVARRAVRCAAPRAARRRTTPVDGAIASRRLRAAATANPDSYIAQLALGRALATANDRRGVRAARARRGARSRRRSGDESPHALMAALAEKLGDKARAMQELERCCRRPHERRGRARARRRSRNRPATTPTTALALTASSRSIRSTPPRTPARAGRVEAAARRPTATREFRAALAPAPPTRPPRTATSARLPAREPAAPTPRRRRSPRSNRAASSARRTCCSTAVEGKSMTRGALAPHAARRCAAAGLASVSGSRVAGAGCAARRPSPAAPDAAVRRAAVDLRPRPVHGVDDAAAAGSRIYDEPWTSTRRPPSRTCRAACDRHRRSRSTTGRHHPRGSRLCGTTPGSTSWSRGNLRMKDTEVPILREFLLRGGTLTFDDFHGPIEWANLERS